MSNSENISEFVAHFDEINEKTNNFIESQQNIIKSSEKRKNRYLGKN